MDHTEVSLHPSLPLVTTSLTVSGLVMSEQQEYCPESWEVTWEMNSLVVETPGTFSDSKEMPGLSLAWNTLPSFFQ